MLYKRSKSSTQSNDGILQLIRAFCSLPPRIGAFEKRGLQVKSSTFGRVCVTCGLRSIYLPVTAERRGTTPNVLDNAEQEGRCRGTWYSWLLKLDRRGVKFCAFLGQYFFFCKSTQTSDSSKFSWPASTNNVSRYRACKRFNRSLIQFYRRANAKIRILSGRILLPYQRIFSLEHT